MLEFSVVISTRTLAIARNRVRREELKLELIVRGSGTIKMGVMRTWALQRSSESALKHVFSSWSRVILHEHSQAATDSDSNGARTLK